MSVFIGIIVLEPITNQLKYEQVIIEIFQFLKAHEDDLSISINQRQSVAIRSKDGFDQVMIPLNVAYLETKYFRIYQGELVTDRIKQFGAITWEIFHIMRSHFPSKIHLFQQSLEVCEPFYHSLRKSEELRRQLSAVLSRSEQVLTQDDIEDIWHTIYFADSLKDYKSHICCLEILLKQSLLISHQSDLVFLQKIVDDKQLSSTPSQDLIAELSGSILKKYSEIDPQEDYSEASDQKRSSKVSLFYLTESNDVGKVYEILLQMNCLPQKHKLYEKIVIVMRKYCEGIYGFQHKVICNGEFQQVLIQLLTKIKQDSIEVWGVVVEMLEGAIKQLFNSSLINQKRQTEFSSFLDLGVNFLEIGLSLNGFLPKLNVLMIRLMDVICKLGERTSIDTLEYYYSYFGEDVQEKDEQYQCLKQICYPLYKIGQRIERIIIKIEAIQEYQEGQKSDRVFSETHYQSNKENKYLCATVERDTKRETKREDNPILDQYKTIKQSMELRRSDRGF